MKRFRNLNNQNGKPIIFSPTFLFSVFSLPYNAKNFPDESTQAHVIRAVAHRIVKKWKMENRLDSKDGPQLFGR
jgi:hypothetical protein